MSADWKIPGYAENSNLKLETCSSNYMNKMKKTMSPKTGYRWKSYKTKQQKTSSAWEGDIKIGLALKHRAIDEKKETKNRNWKIKIRKNTEYRTKDTDDKRSVKADFKGKTRRIYLGRLRMQQSQTATVKHTCWLNRYVERKWTKQAAYDQRMVNYSLKREKCKRNGRNTLRKCAMFQQKQNFLK